MPSKTCLKYLYWLLWAKIEVRTRHSKRSGRTVLSEVAKSCPLDRNPSSVKSFLMGFFSKPGDAHHFLHFLHKAIFFFLKLPFLVNDRNPNRGDWPQLLKGLIFSPCRMASEQSQPPPVSVGHQVCWHASRHCCYWQGACPVFRERESSLVKQLK